MSDKKISQLTAATTPLAGTEVLPVVQGTTTVKVANNDLRPKQIQSNSTTGVLQVTGPAAAQTRVMTTPDANFTVARTDTGQTFTGSQVFSTDQDATVTSIYNTKSTGFNNALNFVRSDQNTTNDTFRAYSYYNGGANAYKFYVTDGGSMYAAGGVSIGNTTDPGAGNLRFNTTGSNGIYFGASSQLNDYEEGTWTPVLAGGTTAGTWNGYGYGNYRKIGKTVFIWWEISTTGSRHLTGASGNLIITNLPYAQSGTRGGIDVSTCGGFAGLVLGTSPYGIVDTNVIYLEYCTTYATGNLTVASNYADGCYLYGSATYTTA